MKSLQKLLGLVCFGVLMLTHTANAQTMVQVNASDANIQYTGRINNTDPNNVVFAYPGVSIKAKFTGTALDAILVEGGSGGTSTTNYFNVIIDGGTPTVLKLSSAQTVYHLATRLTDATHTVELFKRTETSVGKVTFKGFQVVSGKSLVTPDPLPSRKVEFIGNSITCGYGNESSTNPPVNGFTSVNENNYKAWGAVTARNLNAQYHCTAYSGRGLYRNNSGSQVGTAPTFYDQTIADDASQTWDHTKYVPDVVVINLGTNDFAAEASSAAYTVDSTTFVNAYIAFISKLRGYYPNANFVLCVGVMMSDYYPAGTKAWTRIQNYVSSVKTYKNSHGDSKVFYYMMDPQSPPYGEDWHPTAATDVIMATGLTNFINANITWNSCAGSVNLGKDINIKNATYPITLNSNSNANTGVTYKWTKDGSVISGATSPTYQITSASGAIGNYSVERDSGSCKLQSSVNVTNTLQPVGTVCKWNKNKSAAVALTFDDWTPGQFPIAVPELKSRNIPATFFVIAGNVSSWADVNTAASYGNEIGNHTMTHAYASSSSQYASEVVGAKAKIESNVPSQKVFTFAYPFGSTDANLIAELQLTGHIGARGVIPAQSFPYNFAPTVSDYYNINSFAIDNTVTTQSYSTQIQNAIGGGGFLVFMYHSVNSATITDNVYNTISQTALQSQLDACVSFKNQAWFTTFAQAIKYQREALCASLVEAQAPDGTSWIVNLTDTLSDNTTYNQPLTIILNTNGVTYDQIIQNGKTLTIDSSYSGNIMFNAIPNGGNIVLKASSGIGLTATVSPTSVTNSSSSTVTVTATASSSSNLIAAVTVDLSSIGGSKTAVMTSTGNNKYSVTYSVASGTVLGTKTLIVTATDNASHQQSTNVTLTISSGTTISLATVSPNTVVNNISNTLTFALNATDDGSVTSVTLDLSAIGGGSSVAMTSTGSNNYTYSYSLAPTSITGIKTITINVTDNAGNVTPTTVSVAINPSVSYLDIYTDASTMINGSWTGVTTDAIVEQSNVGAIEGVKDYKYSYTIASYWAGMGLSLTNFSDALAKDFSGYDSLQISYKGPITSGTGFNLSLIGLANKKSTSVSFPSSSTYTTVKVGLKQFGIDLTKITQLAFDITGSPSGTGSMQFDNIRLSKAVVVTNIPVTSISFTSPSTAMTVGGTQTITAVVLPSNATDATLTWSSSDATIATVSTSGVVTAVKAGSVTITATSNSAKTITKSLTIVISDVLPSAIAITPTGTQTVNIGSTVTLSASVTPTNAADKTVSWSSSDNTKATVDGNGKVTGIATGSVTITVTSNAVSTLKATSTINVTAVPVSSISVTPTGAQTMTVSDTKTFTATSVPSNATDPTLTWTTSDATVATVTNGIVTAVKAGSATITVTSVSTPSVTATISLTISDVLPSSLSITPIGSQSVVIGSKIVLSTTVSPSNAADKTVTWTSSDKTIATVDAAGVVTGIKTGTVTISATSNAVSTVKATSSVTVTAITVSSIVLSPNSVQTMTVGDAKTFTATVSPSNATDASLTWTSSDATVATVTNGVVNALKAGTITITVASVSTPSVTASISITISDILPTAITITPSGSQSVFVGGNAVLTATISPSNSANQSVTWSSSDNTIASIDATGNITGIKAGSVTITATSNSVSTVTATSLVTVSNVLVSGITVVPSASSLIIGHSSQLTASVSPANATLKTITWSSSNTSVLTIDGTGTIKALAVGTVTVSATANDASGISGTSIITVTPVLPISISANDIAMPISETTGKTITYTFTPLNTTDKSVTFVSNDPNIATVDANGLIIPVSVGNTFVTITSLAVPSVTKNVGITITATTIDITGVTVDIPSVTLAPGKTQTITPTITPANASGTTISWSSSDATIASVDVNGVVTVVAPGNATITVTVNAGSLTKTATTAVTVQAILVSSISLDQTALNLTIASAPVQLSATLLPSNATNSSLTWSSDNTTAATVSQTGVVSVVGIGTATITCKANDTSGKLATCSVTVTSVSPTAISLNTSPITVSIGDTKTLSASVIPATAPQGITWSSTDATVASVNANGTITALKTGTSTITATSQAKGSITNNVAITVVAVPVSSISLNQTSLSLTLASTPTVLSATVSPANATNTSVTWASTNQSVVNVTNGVVTVVGVGSATITATANDGSGKVVSIPVTVANVTPTSITLNANPIAINIGDTKTLLASVVPALAPQGISWSSSDATIASVDANGVVTAKKAGSAIITAASQSKTSVLSSVSVTVSKISVSSLNVDKTSVSVNDKGSQAFVQATIAPANATNKNIIWTSANPSLATVSSGIITGVAQGSTTVTATSEDNGSILQIINVTISHVTVNVPVNSISLDNVSLSLIAGKSSQLSATIYPANASNTAVIYTSTAPLITSVDGTGMVTAISAGTATITATTVDGSYSANATVSVTMPIVPLTGFSINGGFSSVTINKGDNPKVTISYSPSNTTETGLTFTSSDTSVATVDSYGQLNGIKGGTTTITVVSNSHPSLTKTIVITVVEPVSSIVLDASYTTINIGDSTSIFVNVSQPTASNKSVTVSIDAPSIATLKQKANSTDYILIGKMSGKVTITAKANDGSNTVSNKLVITIEKVPVSNIILKDTISKLEIGKQITLTVTTIPSNATNNSVSFTSSNKAVATVTATGIITAISEGTTLITIASIDNPFVTKTITITVPTKALMLDSLTTTYNNGLLVVEKYSKDAKMNKTAYYANLIAKMNEAQTVFNGNSKNDTQSQIDQLNSDLITAIAQVNCNCTTASNEVQLERISLYPNPVADVLQVNGESITAISIFDMQGKRIVETQSSSIDLSKTPAGIYKVVIKSKDGISIHSVVKQ